MKSKALPDLSSALHTHVQVLNQSLNHRQLFVLCASTSSCSNPTWVIYMVTKAPKGQKAALSSWQGIEVPKGGGGLHHRQGLPLLYQDLGDRQNRTRLQMSHQPLMQKMPDSREENVRQATYYIHSPLSPTVVRLLFSGRAALRCFYMLRGGKKGKSHFATEDKAALFRNFLHGKLFKGVPTVWSVFYENIECDSVERIPPPRPSSLLYPLIDSSFYNNTADFVRHPCVFSWEITRKSWKTPSYSV